MSESQLPDDDSNVHHDVIFDDDDDFMGVFPDSVSEDTSEYSVIDVPPGGGAPVRDEMNIEGYDDDGNLIQPNEPQHQGIPDPDNYTALDDLFDPNYLNEHEIVSAPQPPELIPLGKILILHEDFQFDF
jgi:hypothetical protein